MIIKGMKEIIDNYDSFILDVWGVIHDGRKVYPGVKEVLKEFDKMKKPYFFLSNSPRPSLVTFQKFQEIGLDFVKKEQITTSGDFFLYELNSNNRTVFDKLQGKVFVIDENKNMDLLAGQKVNRADKIEDADYILLLSYLDLGQTNLNEHNEVFNKAIELGIPAICPNPDKVATYGSGNIYTVGAFAEHYEKLGGRVYYFGKPYKAVYEYISKKYGIKSSKTLAVGDAVETDILGAKNFGVDSVFVLGGIHKSDRDVQSVFERFDVQPTYTINIFNF